MSTTDTELTSDDEITFKSATSQPPPLSPSLDRKLSEENLVGSAIYQYDKTANEENVITPSIDRAIEPNQTELSPDITFTSPAIFTEENAVTFQGTRHEDAKEEKLTAATNSTHSELSLSDANTDIASSSAVNFGDELYPQIVVTTSENQQALVTETQDGDILDEEKLTGASLDRDDHFNQTDSPQDAGAPTDPVLVTNIEHGIDQSSSPAFPQPAVEEEEKDSSGSPPQPLDINTPSTSLRHRTSYINYKEDEQDDRPFSSDSDDEFLASQETQNSPNSPGRIDDLVTIENTNLTAQETCKRQNSKKSKKLDQLGLDNFDPKCVSDKEAKLKTDRPLALYQALRHYVQSHNLKNRMELKKHKNKRVSIVKLRLVSMDMKDICLSLNFVTGVLHVKSSRVRNWIENDFSEVKDNGIWYQPSAQKQISPATPNCNSINSSNNISSSGSSGDKIQEDHGDIRKVDQTEIANIWSEIDSFKTALKSIEDSVGALSCKIDGLVEKCNKSETKYEARIDETSVNLHSTVSTYQDVIHASTKEEMEKLTTKLNNKISNLKDELGKFQSSVSEQLTNVLDEQEKKLKEENDGMQQLGKQIERAKFNFTEDLNELDKRYDDQFNSINTQITELKDEMRSSNTSSSEHPEVQQSTSSRKVTFEPTSPDAMHDEKTILIMCMDSNGKYLDKRKLWDLNGTKHEKKFTLDEVHDFIDQDINYTNLKYFFMSVGCNDCDTLDAETVVDKLKSIVAKLKSRYPLIKIIVSEITPRKDDRDEIVKDANVLINRFVKESEKVFVVRNSNLRNRNYTFHEDNKHISSGCIAKFAANIKHALRVAYGRKKFEPASQHLHNTTYNNYSSQQPSQTQIQQQQQQQIQQLLWFLNNISPQQSGTQEHTQYGFSQPIT